MSESRLAARYAEALLHLAQARRSVDVIRSELRDLVELIETTPELRRLLERPDMGAAQKLEALREGLGGRFSETVMALLATLLRHHRGETVAEVLEAYEELADRAAGVIRAEARTVIPLSEQQRARLVAVLEGMTGKKVKLEERVDPTVLAGMRLQVGDRLIDGSAAGRLARMRKELTGGRGRTP